MDKLLFFYLSFSAEGEIFPTEVSDDSRRQSVAQDVDHGPKPVAAETERPGDTVRPELLLEVLVSLLSQLGCSQPLIMFVTYRMKSQCYGTFWDFMLRDICYFADSNFRYKTLSASLLLSLTGSSRWPR